MHPTASSAAKGQAGGPRANRRAQDGDHAPSFYSCEPERVINADEACVNASTGWSSEVVERESQPRCRVRAPDRALVCAPVELEEMWELRGRQLPVERDVLVSGT